MSDAVHRFRRLTGRKGGKPVRPERPAVPPRERALVAVILLNVVWLVFSMGGVKMWGELTSLGLTLLALLLIPRWKNGEIQMIPSPAAILLKLPLFWLGFCLYGYFFIQSWNIAWEWQLINGRPYLVSVEPLLKWLPTGIVAPLDESNPLRSMIFYSIPWINCCCAWAGLNTRRSVLSLLHGLAFIGVAFSVISLGQHFLHWQKILGIFPELPSRADSQIPFWGTLHNSNHAAYFLIIATGTCLGLFVYGWYRDLRNFKRTGGIWLLYLGLAFLGTFSVLMAQARGAIIFILLQWVLFILVCTVFFFRRFGWIGMLLPGIFILIVFSTTAAFMANPEIFENQKREWSRTLGLVETPELEARYYMMQIASDMIRDKPVYGHGAGSWRYLHLPYLRKYPEFSTRTTRWRIDDVSGKRELKEVTIWFQNAHVDLFEYLVEWGLVGCLFPLSAGGWLIYRGMRARDGRDPGIATLLTTVTVVFLGGLLEFHFRIPLVLLAWSLLFVLTIKLSELNARIS